MNTNSFQETFEMSLESFGGILGFRYSYTLENEDVLMHLQFEKRHYEGVSNAKFKFWLKKEDVDFYICAPEAISLVENSFYGPDKYGDYRNDRVFKAMIEYYEKEIKN
jgi:hypothetical protein